MSKDVSAYGYDLVGLKAGHGYNFVPVGQLCLVNDEQFEADPSGGTWVVLMTSYLIGQTIGRNWRPIRRPLKARWSCGHGRDSDHDHCIVCAVFMRYVTD